MYGSLRALALSARDQFAAVTAEPNTRIVEREEFEPPPDVPRAVYDRAVEWLNDVKRTMYRKVSPEMVHHEAVKVSRWILAKGVKVDGLE